jgi:hypothetical protein
MASATPRPGAGQDIGQNDLQSAVASTAAGFRTLPSEGKGQRFESPRARHEINDLALIDLMSVPVVSRRESGSERQTGLGYFFKRLPRVGFS